MTSLTLRGLAVWRLHRNYFSVCQRLWLRYAITTGLGWAWLKYVVLKFMVRLGQIIPYLLYVSISTILDTSLDTTYLIISHYFSFTFILAQSPLLITFLPCHSQLLTTLKSTPRPPRLLHLPFVQETCCLPPIGADYYYYHRCRVFLILVLLLACHWRQVLVLLSAPSTATTIGDEYYY